MHLPLITETRRQVYGIFIGNQSCFLLKRFILIIEHIVHYIIFDDS